MILESPYWSKTEFEQVRSLVKLRNAKNCFYFASSGSSRLPGQSLKVIELPKDSLEASAAAFNSFWRVHPADVFLRCLPRFHVGGIGVEFRAQISGAKLIELNQPWKPKLFLQTVEINKVTLTSLVPAQVHDLVSKNFTAPKSLRGISVGGGFFDSKLAEQAAALGWPVVATFGMTETSSQIASGDLNCPLSMKLLSHVQARSNSGQLEVCCTSLMSAWGQINDEKKEWNEIPKGSWWTTSDRAEISGNVLFPLGRLSREIKILGETVSLDFLEAQLSQALQVDLAVLTKEDPRKGFKLFLVIPEQVANEKEWLALANAELPGLAKIESIIRIAKIPRSPLGKILYAELNQELHSIQDRFPQA